MLSLCREAFVEPEEEHDHPFNCKTGIIASIRSDRFSKELIDLWIAGLSVLAHRLQCTLYFVDGSPRSDVHLVTGIADTIDINKVELPTKTKAKNQVEPMEDDAFASALEQIMQDAGALIGPEDGPVIEESRAEEGCGQCVRVFILCFRCSRFCVLFYSWFFV